MEEKGLEFLASRDRNDLPVPIGGFTLRRLKLVLDEFYGVFDIDEISDISLFALGPLALFKRSEFEDRKVVGIRHGGHKTRLLFANKLLVRTLRKVYLTGPLAAPKNWGKSKTKK
jgi:hypothetical protein